MGHYHGNQRKNINNGYTQIRMTMCRQNAILLGNIIPTTDSLNVSFFSISFLITYVVYTDGLEHTARSFGASLPLVQYTLSGKQSNPLFCLITKGHI